MPADSPGSGWSAGFAEPVRPAETVVRQAIRTGDNVMIADTTRLTLRFAVIAMFANMAFASAASAQDAMQRDLMFRESLLRKTSPQEQAGLGLAVPNKATQRHPGRRQRQKT